MDHGQNLDQEVDPGSRVDDYRGFHVMLGDELQGAVQVAAGFVLHADPAGAGSRKLFDELIGILNHQMAVEWQVGYPAQRLDDRGSHSEVGNKVTIHDVDMDNRAAAALGGLNFRGQLREIGREDGWHQFNHDDPSNGP